jgi:glycosyltransferase involved in cell wall biosynthesis
MYLSIITPFFNAEKKSKSLLKTISKLKYYNIEFIFIDDGSTDSTYSILLDFKEKMTDLNIHLIKQENKGPGGARNSGLKVSQGKYVWFVDSDDDITTDALDFIQENHTFDFDFIEFLEKENLILVDSMEIKSGSYSDANQVISVLFKNFGRIHSKIFKREVLIKNDIYYPEYCYYEDVSLPFILPFSINKFFKTDIVGYIYNIEPSSITNSPLTLRTLDRLYSLQYGFEKGCSLTNNQIEIDLIKQKFLKHFLFRSVEVFRKKTPHVQWITTWRIMKNYRELASHYNISINPLVFLGNKEINPTYDYKFKLYFYFHWFISFFIFKEQNTYFKKIRKAAWPALNSN